MPGRTNRTGLNMSDDFDSLLSNEPDDDEDRHIAMVVGRRCVNSVEFELIERLYIDRLAALGDVDEVPLSETDDDEERQRVAAHQALVARLIAPAAEKWSRQIEVARSLGLKADERMYVAACEREGIEPWPKENDHEHLA